MSRLSMFANARNTPRPLHQLIQEIQGGSGSLGAEQIDQLIKGLPHINEKQLADLGENDSSCPICFTPYLALIAEEEMALAMDSPAHPVDTIGVTKLSQPWQCGHIFCRRDISKWIIDGHDSCPLCRHTLIESNQSRQDNEISREPVPLDTDDNNVVRANIEELRAQLTNVDGIVPIHLAFGFYDPDRPLQREENGDHGVAYSGMYS